MCIDSSCAMLHHTFHSKHHSTNAHSLICTIVLFISGAVQSSSIMHGPVGVMMTLLLHTNKEASVANTILPVQMKMYLHHILAWCLLLVVNLSSHPVTLMLPSQPDVV